MSELLSSVVGGGGGLPQLAPDLNWPANLHTTKGYVRVTGIPINYSTFSPLITLTGKFYLSYMALDDMVSLMNYDLRLTVDDEVKWDSTFTAATVGTPLLGAFTRSSNPINSTSDVGFIVKKNMLLELKSGGGGAVSATLEYIAKPIL